MTLISYAQNFEDVLLHRALASVKRGTYIDVGAGDPQLDSVTKAFSDEGWSGINVEPLSAFHARLIAERPQDVNIRAAVVAEPGTIAFYEVEGYPELSTTVPEVAADLRAHGRVVVEQLVPARTLDDIWAEHAAGPVHFLKIDVEGGELAVLEGTDLKKRRPWIIVIETVAFGRATDDAAAIEKILTRAKYRRVYFDGLNVFYLADEHGELAAAFEVPVNVRDDFRVPVEGRAKATLDRIAGLLGLEAGANEHEVLERLESLASDRVRFEKSTLEAIALRDEMIAQRDAAVAAARGVEIELDAYRQQSFERERYVAWQATEILRVELERPVPVPDDSAERLREVLTSTSWRVSLPLRVIRRPGAYLRKLSGR